MDRSPQRFRYSLPRPPQYRLRFTSATKTGILSYTEKLTGSAKRHRDLGRHRTRMACRLHAVLCELVPGGVAGEITAGQATKLLDSIDPRGAIETARHELALELVDDLVRIDTQMRATKKRITAAVSASKTTVTDIFGVGPIVAAIVVGDVGDVARFATRGQLRRLQRDRTHRGVVGAPQDLPAVAAREPPHQPRHPHGRSHPDPPPPQRRAGLLRPQTRRRQDRQRSHPGPQTANQ
jgi:hypothetical protein